MPSPRLDLRSVTFTPPSSIPSGFPVGPLAVTVSNFPADQLVHFVQPVAVTGPLTAAELTAAGLATEATLADVLAALAGLVTSSDLSTLAAETTLERVAEALTDIGLTAILERERLEP